MKRVITGVILGLIALPILIFSDTIIFPIVAGLLSAGGAYEMLSVMKLKKKFIISIPLIMYACFMPMATIFSRTNRFLMFSVLCLFIYLAFIKVIFGDRLKVDHIAFAFMGVFVVAVSFYSFCACKVMFRRDYLLIIIGACCTDIFALYTGMKFGKRKLCPTISPKKTVEGAIGGVIGCVISFLIYGLICKIFLHDSQNIGILLLVSVPISIISQFGDLFFSCIKRRFNVKDYGTIFPAHGGILDRFDSILAVSLCGFVFILLRGMVS